jgi:hypothetical protein
MPSSCKPDRHIIVMEGSNCAISPSRGATLDPAKLERRGWKSLHKLVLVGWGADIETAGERQMRHHGGSFLSAVVCFLVAGKIFIHGLQARLYFWGISSSLPATRSAAWLMRLDAKNRV